MRFETSKKGSMAAAMFVLAFVFAATGWAEEQQPPKDANQNQQQEKAVVHQEGTSAGPTEQQRKDAIAPFTEKLKQADELWNTRYKKGGSKKVLNFLRKLYKDNPNNFEVAWRLARAAFWVAEQSKSKDVKEKVGYEGYKAGLAAKKMNPKRVEGYHWAAACLGQYAKGVGILSALMKGLGGKFESLVKQAMKIDKTYTMAGPLRSLGRYYYSLPWPKRDLEKAEKLLSEAVRIAPKKLRNHAWLADVYLKDDRKEMAIKEYKACANGNPKQDEDYTDALLWKEYCMQKLKELGAK